MRIQHSSRVVDIESFDVYSYNFSPEMDEIDIKEHFTIQDTKVTTELLEIMLDENTSRAAWNDTATRLLIAQFQENSNCVGKNKKYTTYGKLWEHIAYCLKTNGYRFSAQQIKQKWDALVRSYKDTVQSNSNRKVQKRKVCPYESELDQIFGKRRNVLPKYLADGKQEWPSEQRQEEEQPMAESTAADTSEDSVETEPVITADDKRDLRQLLVDQHNERLRETRKYRQEKLEFRKVCEQNRHEERMKLLEIMERAYKNT